MRSEDPIPHDATFDAELLDLHLGRIDAARQADLLARLDADPRLAAQHSELRAALEALRRWDAAAPTSPEDLGQRILARVRAAELAAGPRPRVRPADVELNDNPHIIRIHGFRDILAVAAMIVVAVGIGVPSMLHMKDRSQRTACASNLAQIGRGMQAYTLAFGSHLPFVGWDQQASWRPTAERGTQLRPNRGHLYPLVRSGHASSRWLVCPSSRRDVPMASELVGRLDTFPEARNLSYAYQNMAGQRPRVDQQAAAMPVLGDDNPLFDNGVPIWEDAAHRLGLRDLALTNSRAHNGAGQNVLALDGSAKWFTTPEAGVDRDNIWTLSGVETYTGREGPQSASDAHLLK